MQRSGNSAEYKKRAKKMKISAITLVSTMIQLVDTKIRIRPINLNHHSTFKLSWCITLTLVN